MSWTAEEISSSVRQQDKKMTTTQITGLIAALYADFTEKMAPAWPPEQNYNAARMKRGPEILAAHIASENNRKSFHVSQRCVYSAAELS